MRLRQCEAKEAAAQRAKDKSERSLKIRDESMKGMDDIYITKGKSAVNKPTSSEDFASCDEPSDDEPSKVHPSNTLNSKNFDKQTESNDDDGHKSDGHAEADEKENTSDDKATLQPVLRHRRKYTAKALDKEAKKQRRDDVLNRFDKAAEEAARTNRLLERFLELEEKKLEMQKAGEDE